MRRGTTLSVCLGLIGILATPLWSDAASCTPGTDCYCDKVKGNGPLGHADPLYDSNLLMCADFEIPTYTSGSGLGNGAPFYGPPYDDTGAIGDRGRNSAWHQSAGLPFGQQGGSGTLWQRGEPGPTNIFGQPTLGNPCLIGSFQECNGIKFYDPLDRWSANAFHPAVHMIRNGEFDTYIPNATAPTGSAGGGSGVFDGSTSMGALVDRATPLGIYGGGGFPGGVTATASITQALAFASNFGTESPSQLSNNWKFAEWGPAGGGAGDGLFLFNLNGQDNTTNPFYGFVFYGGILNATWCDQDLQAAIGQNCARDGAGNLAMTGSQGLAICAYLQRNVVAVKGMVTCQGTGTLIWQGSTNDYQRPVDWPYGTWGCFQGQFSGIGTTNGHIEQWFTGPAGVRKKVIDLTGYDTHHAFYLSNGMGGYAPNNYANTNSPAVCGTDCMHGPTARYEDNIHITASATAPSCASIGFGGVVPVPTSKTRGSLGSSGKAVFH